jgi:hypothetical protein
LRTLVISALLLSVGLVGMSWSLLRTAKSESEPVLQLKATQVARALSREIVRAVELGVPADNLVAMEEFLRDGIQGYGEMRYAAFTDDRGQVRFSTPGMNQLGGDAGPVLDVAVPVELEKRRLGQLHIGVDSSYYPSQLAATVVRDLVWLVLGSGILLVAVSRRFRSPPGALTPSDAASVR